DHPLQLRLRLAAWCVRSPGAATRCTPRPDRGPAVAMTSSRVFDPLAGATSVRPELATFTYHDVTDDPSDSGFQRPAAMRYKLTRAAFARHLDAIGVGGPPSRIFDVNLAIPGRHHLLTFDDGGQSAVAVADEIARRGWLGHFFVVTRLIGTRRFLTVSEVRYLPRCSRPSRERTCWILVSCAPATAAPLEQVAALAQFRGWRGVLLVRRLKDLARASLPTLYRHYVRTQTREFIGGTD